MTPAAHTRLSSLMAWLRKHGTRMPGCRAVPVPGMGVGIVARHDLAVGDAILSVPPELWLTRKTKHTQFAPVLHAASEEGLFSHSMSRLALLLLLESATSDSFFAPYLAALGPPTMPFEIDAEGAAAPQSADLVAWVAEQAETTVEECLRLGVTLPERFPELVPKRAFTLERWRWAYGHAVQRSFSVDIDEEEVWVMVPGMDLCNHSSSVRNGYYAEEDGWQLESTQAWSAGEQITIHYGPEKTSADFFLYYGFVPTPNPNDRLTLRLVLDADDPDRAAKTEALDVLGLRNTCRVGSDGLLPAAFRNACVLWNLDRTTFATDGIDFADPRYESAALDRIAAGLEAHLAALPTTLAADSEALAQGAGGATRAPILGYRIAFKRVGHQAAGALRAQAAELRAGRARPNAPDPGEGEGSHALLTVEIPVGGGR